MDYSIVLLSSSLSIYDCWNSYDEGVICNYTSIKASFYNYCFYQCKGCGVMQVQVRHLSVQQYHLCGQVVWHFIPSSEKKKKRHSLSLSLLIAPIFVWNWFFFSILWNTWNIEGNSCLLLNKYNKIIHVASSINDELQYPFDAIGRAP